MGVKSKRMLNPIDGPYELLDVVDNGDFVVGQEQKWRVHQRGLLHRHTVMLVTHQLNDPDSEPRLVIGKRSQFKSDNGGLWDRFGGHVRAAESYIRAAQRELMEELLPGLYELDVHVYEALAEIISDTAEITESGKLLIPGTDARLNRDLFPEVYCVRLGRDIGYVSERVQRDGSVIQEKVNVEWYHFRFVRGFFGDSYVGGGGEITTVLELHRDELESKLEKDIENTKVNPRLRQYSPDLHMAMRRYGDVLFEK